MPELPEVEIWRLTLARWLGGRRVRLVVVDPAAVRGALSSSPGRALAGGEDRAREALGDGILAPPLRRGKRLGLRTAGPGGLLVHLGMAGRWVRTPDPPRHARVGLVPEEGVPAWLVDPRRFGCVVPAGDLAAALDEGLGPDALADALDPGRLAAACGRRPVKVALLDQAVLAGLGNIHAAEVLFAVGIAPGAPAASLGPARWRALAEAIPAHLRAAVARDLGAEGVAYLSQGAENPFAVYGRASCPACGGPVSRAALGGRTTWWCPACQRA